MSLSKIFKSVKGEESLVIKPLEDYLNTLSAKDSDRAINVNAPSSVGGCLRARYYSRIEAESDGDSIEPRTRRIFDNGTHVHLRLQEYMRECGLLLMDEVPIYNPDYNIQGHTDGILQLPNDELGVLEIKSINSRSFGELKTAKPEHQMQGLVYLYCLEQNRQYLKDTFSDAEDFNKSRLRRRKIYTEMYSYLQDGEKYSREEKIKFQVNLCMRRDLLLYRCKKPITKVVFLYENKDTQDLKEYLVTSSEPSAKTKIEEVLTDCRYLNQCVEEKTVPERCTNNKNDFCCKWCSYKTECWC